MSVTSRRVLVLDQAVGLWGAQQYLIRLAGPMAERGFELVLGSPAHLELAEVWAASGREFLNLPLPTERSVRSGGSQGRLSPGLMAREAKEMRRSAAIIAEAAGRENCQVIHANGHGVHMEAALAARRSPACAVLHLHEEMPQLFGTAVRAAAVGLSPASVAVSRAVARSVPRMLRHRVTVIPNGIDTAVLSPGPVDRMVRAELGAGAEDVLVVALTRLDPVKRIEDVVRSVVPLIDISGWHLAVVGETSSFPEYAEEVRQEAKRLLGDRVTFAGRRSDVSAVLRSADILVHAGLVEGMPLGLLEAQSTGLPVAAYRVAGVPEAVIHGETGLLASAGDVEALATHVRALVTNSTLRSRLGQAARAHAVAHHSLERQADDYAYLLNHLLSSQAGRFREAA